MKTSLNFFAWILLALALGACGLVVYGGLYLLDEATLRAAAVTSSEQQMSRVAYNERMKALAKETEGERARLEELARVEIPVIVTMLEAVGTSAGVTMRVSDAVVEGAGTHIVDGVTLRSVSFLVNAEGGFQNIIRASELLEKLSLPSNLVQVEIAKNGEANTVWHMSGRVRVLTTAPVTI